MKFLLILSIAIYFIIGVVTAASEEDSFESLSPKEKLRSELERELYRINERGFERQCRPGLTPKQILLGNQKFEELVLCANATIDLFINKLDDNRNFYDITTPSEGVREFAAPVCEIFDDIFRCVSDFIPAIDLCLSKYEKVYKDKLFTIVPLIHQTVCLRNGALLADIAELPNGLRCAEITFSSMANIGITELFNSNSTQMFDDANVCQAFNVVLKQIYQKLGECSLDVLEMVKDMLGFFCEGTQCDRYIDDLKCY